MGSWDWVTGVRNWVGGKRLFTGFDGALHRKRLFTGFNGNLHSESLWGRVWLHIFDRLALVSTPKTLLSIVGIVSTDLHVFTLARVFLLMVMAWDILASRMLVSKELESVVLVRFGDRR